MYIRWIATILLFTFTRLAAGQDNEKKVLTPDQWEQWKEIENTAISNNGNWIVHDQVPGKGDPQLVLYNTRSNIEEIFKRGSKGAFTADNTHLFFTIYPPHDTIHLMKVKGTAKDKLPPDTLIAYHIETMERDSFSDVKNYNIPKQWDGWVFIEKEMEEKKDTAKTKSTKKEEKDKLKQLILYNTTDESADTLMNVTQYQFAKDTPHLLVAQQEGDSIKTATILRLNLESEGSPDSLFHAVQHKVTGLTISDDGQQFGFLTDTILEDKRYSEWALFISTENGRDVNKALQFKKDDTSGQSGINEHFPMRFSTNGKYLYFGTAPFPLLQDTSLIEEDIVQVEVWHYKDGRLYPEQKVKLGEDKKKSYAAVYDLEQQKAIQLGEPEAMPEVIFAEDTTLPWALGVNSLPYETRRSWLGLEYKNIFYLDLQTGNATLIAEEISGNPKISPGGQYVYWYQHPDSAWYAFHVKSGNTVMFDNNQNISFADELNDRPMHPSPYGVAGWTSQDSSLLVYDRYDIWAMNPRGNQHRKLTNGRENNIVYRFIDTDPEEEAISEDTLLLHSFNRETKDEGYMALAFSTGNIMELVKGPYHFTLNVVGALNSEDVVYTKENFQIFPNLIHSTMNFDTAVVISDANPQQKDYLWGDIQLVKWEDSKGNTHEGLLVKPENFDSTNKYPLLINFYERSADRIHRHPTIRPHRSTINYAWYASRGYIIFNPDIHYEVGYPGRSAFEDVMSGADAMLQRGFIDSTRMGLQGHSWGGYQIADIITRTGRFACAESGAPVVNMTSAYGGIRWGTGRSRMFQYEHTQSRIGGTLWEETELYLKNSPLFRIDQITTPVLILHNDKDGAVPWYQGIEFFTAMRRLGKPAWLLNYNEEPHWPLKWKNRVDFNIRMSQFFDHFLMHKPMPEWMAKGIPAIEQGINKGYEIPEENSRSNELKN